MPYLSHEFGYIMMEKYNFTQKLSDLYAHCVNEG